MIDFSSSSEEGIHSNSVQSTASNSEVLAKNDMNNFSVEDVEMIIKKMEDEKVYLPRAIEEFRSLLINVVNCTTPDQCTDAQVK